MRRSTDHGWKGYGRCTHGCCIHGCHPRGVGFTGFFINCPNQVSMHGANGDHGMHSFELIEVKLLFI